MVKKASSDGVYRVTEVIGTSKVSWEDAAKNAVTGEQARRCAICASREVSKLDLKVGGRQGRRLSRAGPVVLQVRRLTGRPGSGFPERKPLPRTEIREAPGLRALQRACAAP